MALNEPKSSREHQLRELAQQLVVEGCDYIRSEIARSRKERRGEIAKVISGAAVLTQTNLVLDEKLRLTLKDFSTLNKILRAKHDEKNGASRKHEERPPFGEQHIVTEMARSLKDAEKEVADVLRQSLKMCLGEPHNEINKLMHAALEVLKTNEEQLRELVAFRFLLAQGYLDEFEQHDLEQRDAKLN
jgi:hypothetical protein